MIDPVLQAQERTERAATPSDLLRPDLAVVPFTGREAVLTDLLSWCLAPTAFAVRLVTGAGGQGKTRLAREVALNLARQDWVAGFLAPDRSGAEPDLSASDTPVLLVMDYAETRLPQLERLLGGIWDASGVAPVRLLLLARSAGDWWTRLRLDHPEALATATVTSLDAPDTRADERQEAWRAALAAFAARLPEVGPASEWEKLPEAAAAPADLLSETYGSPLNLQVAAVTALLQAAAPSVAGSGAPALLDILLRHEERYWRRSAAARELGYQPSTLKLVVAAATLLGADGEDVAVATVARIPGLTGLAADARLTVAQWIAELFPAPPDQYWGTLQPDRLGEYLVAEVMTANPGLLSLLVADAPYTQASRAFLVLSRLAVHRPDLVGQIEALLGDRFDRLAPIAVRSAGQAEDPALITDSVVRVGRRVSVSQVLLAVDQLVAGRSAAFSDVAVRLVGEAIERLLDTFRQRPDYYLDEPAPIRVLIDLAARLTDLGRHAQALEAAEESVAAFRSLAARRPDLFTRDLASALKNKSISLLNLGRLDAAQAAAEEAARLFDTGGDGASLAVTHNLMGAIARDRGDESGAERQYEQALGILDRSGRLSEAEPADDQSAVQVGAHGELQLELRNFAGPTRWRWVLRDGDGLLADHLVDLGTRSDELEAFTDLYGYLRRNAVPDRRTASEAQIVARVGAWAGRVLLGEEIGQAIAQAAPVTVRVVVPAHAEYMLSWPLELAWAGERPLAARGDVTFAYDVGRGRPGLARADGVRRGLRMLAVFTLPSSTSVLSLRRQRYELTRLVRRIAARQRRQVELTVVQYGVTRERLAALADAGAGWDVLHLSGHGGRGQFLLERPDGSPDPVDSADVVRLLKPLRRRVRLAVVLASESSAATTADTLRWIGLPRQAERLEHEAAWETAEADQVMSGLAQVLSRELNCPVVGMRYPVADDFAIAFTADLYKRLLAGRPSSQPLGEALARAVVAAAGAEPTPARPALSLVTPALLVGQRARLELEVPRGEPGLDPALVRMERFPAEPERFVGRAEPMAKASAALSGESGRTGVLLYGMAGSGKTACALELAYRHQDSFAAAMFWQAPLAGDEFGGALAGMAAAMEIQLGGYGFALADKITTMQSVEAFAPRLRRLVEDCGVLIVLDNLDSLLTPGGAWRDPRWGPLIGALAGHRGESRVVLTSRIPPAQIGSGVLQLPINALDLSESIALARELPGLRRLLHADIDLGLPSDDEAAAADRDLARRVLRVVQGNPKLMELANAAAAAGSAQLAVQLTAAETAADGQMLDAFFQDGTASLDTASFLGTLAAWTISVLAALSRPAQLMAQFLACLEEDDRLWMIIDGNWADLWQRLAEHGTPPSAAPLLAALARVALIQPGAFPEDEAGDQAEGAYRMHPGIAQAIRTSFPSDIQAATDAELAAFWSQASAYGRDQETAEAGRLIVKAGVAAAPYLLRLHSWDTASALLEQALIRDTSPATVQAVLPALRAIAQASDEPGNLAVLARALAVVDPAEAEALQRDVLRRAVAAEDFRLAAYTAGTLMNQLIGAGRLREVLDLADQRASYTRQAGLGPWNQLADETRRLQILGLMGEHRQVLDLIPRLLAEMDSLQPSQSADENIEPWNVRETTLDTGRSAAMALGEWDLCLDLGAAILASKQARGASTHEIALTRFNDYRPLLQVGRLADAERLLIECQQVFEDQDDISALAQVLGARADLEDARGNLSAALAFQGTAIRYDYVRVDAREIAIAHHNLANYLRRAGSDPAAQRAHRLAAALIYMLSGMTYYLKATSQALARELRHGPDEELPNTLDDVVRVAERTEGVRLGQLITALQPDQKAAAAALTEILREAAAANPEPEQVSDIQGYLEQWEPIIVATVTAAGGDSGAAAQLSSALDQLAGLDDWAALVGVLRRILVGDRGPGLLDGLDPVDTAITSQVLARLSPSA